MPELPEVETVRRALVAELSGRSLTSLRCHFPGVLVLGRGLSEASVENRSVVALRRRGKLLILDLDAQLTLSVHLRMTGHLCVVEPERARLAHTHVVAGLDDGRELRFVDPRRFGRVELRHREDLERTDFLSRLGPEPFDVDPAVLGERLAFRRGTLKSVLLDQHVIAGLGNIYVDEILFSAGLHPLQEADRLLPRERDALVAAMHRILRAAIEGGGSTIRDYRSVNGEPGDYQDRHLVFGRENEPCCRCATPIRKTKVAGRGTHFCPMCQVKRRRRPRRRLRTRAAHPGPHAGPSSGESHE